MVESSVPRRSSHVRSEAPSLRSAAAGRGVPPTWTTGAKNGIGTSFYNPCQGPSLSNVWYTLSRGSLTEVYYPDVSCANLRQLQWVITDGSTFVETEEADTEQRVELVYQNALVYRQINTSKSGRYRIEKTYTTDPKRHVLMIHMSFHALASDVRDYRQYLYVNPLLNNGSDDVHGEILQRDHEMVLMTTSHDQAMAVKTSGDFRQASVGHAGVDDGLSELYQHYGLVSNRTFAENGNLIYLAELHPTITEGNATYIDVVIAFGDSPEASLQAATASLAEGFDEILAQYQTGWQSYLSQLKPAPVGSCEQYNVAAMVLKAHEDKLNPGAVVASLTIPWGDKVISTTGGIGGYHLVWSRDFYQVVSTLIMIGDLDFARRAIAYLDEIQQRPDGSFPQNSWLDGSPYWPGLQMDEVAYPILLVEQLGETERYHSMVKPAADFLVAEGPYTPQERWEENAGYSPSTLAAEIAALVVAAKMARERSDYASAALYLITADDWARHVDEWTSVEHGSLSDEPYYIRISDTKQPDDGHWIEMKNGGGWHPKADIVDAGFLELVRLGIKSADDKRITHSLDVMDQVLRYDAAYGPVWKRYNFDGYGEHADGSPYDGHGIGRPWPFLTGERGEYEVALQNSKQSSLPAAVYGPEVLLEALAQAANEGYLIPEQIWDGDDLSQWHLKAGEGTGSATPLAWAMAQYIRLAHCIAENRVVEQLDVVADRFLHHPPALGPAIRMDSPSFSSIVSERLIMMKGVTSPGATVIARSADAVESVVADESGQFAVEISLWAIGQNPIELIAYDNVESVSRTYWMVNYEPEMVFAMSDPFGDDNGPGCYTYPTHPDFCPGDFDLRSVRVLVDDLHAYFEIGLVHLDNPWEGATGISKQLIDIYLLVPHLDEPINCATRGLRAIFEKGSGWNRALRVSGNWHGEVKLVKADETVVGNVVIQVQYPTRTISVRVDLDAIGGIPQPGWKILVTVAGEENGHPRPVREHAGEWDFGGGSGGEIHPLILDMIAPPSRSQSMILDWTRRSDGIFLPMVDI